ncbi:MAG: hypothetical protein ACLGIS_00150, partial [Actinomycetes bacterium]
MNVLWITVALLVAGFAGWPVTALVFRLARTIDDKADAAKAAEDAARAAEDPAADVTVDPPPATGQSVDDELTAAAESPSTASSASEPAAPTQRILRGGAIIGILERLGVCLAILTGQPVAIAYIVAIKGLGR